MGFFSIELIVRGQLSGILLRLFQEMKIIFSARDWASNPILPAWILAFDIPLKQPWELGKGL
jgi:hypothetical protein